MKIKHTCLAAAIISAITSLPPSVIAAEVMTAEEAASWLRVTVAEVVAMSERNEIPGRRFGQAGWRFDRQVLEQWLSQEPIRVQNPERPASKDSPGAASGSTAAPEPDTVSPKVPERNPRSNAPTAEEAALRGVGLIGMPGTYTMDARLAYSFNDTGSRGLATLGGRAEAEAFGASLSVAYRISESTQLFATLPYSTRRTTAEDVLGGGLTRSSSRGFESLGVGLRRILVPEAVGRPQISAGADISIPVGTSNRRSLGIELSAMKSLDPITIFATARLERAYDSGPAEIGNRAIVGFGHVYALNDLLAVSTTFNARIEDAPDVSGLGWRRTKQFDLKLGMPVNFGSNGFYLEPHVTFGLNQSNSVTTLGVSLVKTFTP